MKLHAAAVVLALSIFPAFVQAQESVLTVTAASADVYKGPSNVTPVIGHARRGAVLPIARNLGSWVKIDWPDAPDGVGYVHVSMGRIASAAESAASATAGVDGASANTRQGTSIAAQGNATPSSIPPVIRRSAAPQTAPRVQGMSAPATHVFGVGALVGYTTSVGVTARAWHENHIGVQFTVTRNTLKSGLSSDSMTATQFEPSVMYTPLDRVTDYVWLRPYVGTALTFRRATIAGVDGVSNATTGVRVFGGSEFTFASAPRFGLSADAGYRRFNDNVAGFDPSRFTASIAGHWYMR